MTYIDLLETQKQDIIDTIINNANTIIDRFDLTKLSGETLDIYAALYGLQRLSQNESGIYNKIISMIFAEAQESLLIPGGTKLYVNDSVYFELMSDTPFSGTELSLDALLINPSDNQVTIPIMEITRIESSNTYLNNADVRASITREINFQSNEESDEEFKTRLLQYATGKNINTYDRIRYILSTVGVTNYSIVTEKLMIGLAEIVISPPEVNQFDYYKQQIIELSSAIFNDKHLQLAIRAPFLRNLELRSNEKLPLEITEYISSLLMGQAPNLSYISNICGKNTVYILDGVQTTNINLKYYEKVVLYVRQ